jgi:tRNA (guanine-N7-)-methyltransferase
MTTVRVRQHVNPLSQKYQTPLTGINWHHYYTNFQQPFHLDLGCARGKFLLDLAQVHPEWNFLGIEIREPLVEQANLLRDRRGLTNLHYVFANANASLRSLCEPDSLAGVFIQFPDPWFKRRQHKRRLVQPELVADLAVCIRSGGFVFLQSDVLKMAQQMRDRFAKQPEFVDPAIGEWLETNPLHVPTEREVFTLEQGQPVYRSWLIRH